MMSEEREGGLEKAAKELGRELVGVIPGVWDIGMTFGSEEKTGLKIQITCTEEAKAKVLYKYSDESYRGYKFYFRILKEGPRFA